VKVSSERIPEAQVVLTIEVEQERVDAARDKAVRKLAPKAKVPGFRPGKAPPAMVRRYFGEERVMDEALDDLVPDVYKEALDADESIEPIARPRLVVETMEPLVVKATIPVRPTVELGDYKAVRVPIEEVAVDESRVDDTLTTLRRRAATHEPHLREIEWRDIITIDVKAEVPPALTDLSATGPEKMIDQQDIEIQLDEERDVLFPGFEEELLGKRKAQTAEFDLEVPDTVQDPKFAGKKAHFTVHIKETKAETLPELDEEFAKALGEGFESMEAVRERILADITRAEEEQRDNRYHDAILGQLVEGATIEFPPVMLDSEIDRIFHDQVGHFEKQEDLERYLAAAGRTAEEIRDEIRPIADLRLRRSLVLSEVANVEHVEAADEEVEAEIGKMTEAAGAQAQQLRELFSSENGKDTIRRNLVTRKTLALLVESATQDGGAPKAATMKDKPKAKKKASKKTEEAAEEAEAPATAE
jgi:trigger factor